jgi:hypothetical protein
MKEKEDGFIIVFISFFIKVLYHINLIEFLKFIAKKIFSEERLAQNYVIDIFNILKFTFLFFAIHYKMTSTFIIITITYLAFMNLFTYFYYHFWKIPTVRNVTHSRRRFVALTISFFYNILFFSYLYLIKGNCLFKSFIPNFLNSFQISIANAFGADSISEPSNLFAYYLVTLQIATTFVYVTLLLSQILPDTSEKEIL